MNPNDALGDFAYELGNDGPFAFLDVVFEHFELAFAEFRKFVG
jgi:hypothetical protein